MDGILLLKLEHMMIKVILFLLVVLVPGLAIVTGCIYELMSDTLLSWLEWKRIEKRILSDTSILKEYAMIRT